MSMRMFRKFMDVWNSSKRIEDIIALDQWILVNTWAVPFMVENMTMNEILDNCITLASYASVIVKNHDVIEIVKNVICNPDQEREICAIECVMSNT
jgi:hypothetical protein